MIPFVADFANTPVSPQRPPFLYRLVDERAAPAVSIVTPYYNTGPIFLETAQSVWQQSLQQWEWLIVNDGSDQLEALQVLEPFRGQEPRIRVIDLEQNRGLPAARNAGAQAARTDLVFFLDADDLIEPTALEKIAWCLHSYPEAGFCKGLSANFGAEEYLSIHGFDAGNLFLSRNVVTIRAMVRKSVLQAVGGFDETLRQGLEDWDFWLRCAAHGFWGRSIREVLDWYRRRAAHSDRWSAWTPTGVRAMRRELKRRYPRLYAQGVPRLKPAPRSPFAPLPDQIPFANNLVKESRRLLMALPWMDLGGADRFNLDLVTLLRDRGYEISVVTTLPDRYPWVGEFAALTPDLFVLPDFLQLSDYPRFLHYLIRSRQVDAVLVSGSDLGYKCLPYLRAHCPEVPFVDFCHLEEDWNSGGHPRSAVAYHELLDLNLVSSQHLKDWMVDHRADPARIEVCYTNVDADQFRPDPEIRHRVRQELRIPPEQTVLVFVGRICEQKQPRVLAEVLRELKARRLSFLCLVVGDGQDRKWLARALRRARLTGHAWMLGAVDRGRMRELLAAGDILFLPSKFEGISLAIFEAMAMGLVPVSADVGGQRELVTAECGVLIERRGHDQEVAAYADALEALIRSPERRQEMGRAARARVSTHFRLEQMGDRIDQLLHRAADLHRSSPPLAIGAGLGREHALLAIEQEGLAREAGPLWKYRVFESGRSWLASRSAPWLQRVGRVMAPVFGLARQAKDQVWIVGHRLKVRLRAAARSRQAEPD